MNHSLAIIIPAYNEEKSIAAVVHSVLLISTKNNLNATVIVVNDCSTDKTGEIIEHLPCVSLHLTVNLGIGGAMQTGFRFAFENNFDYALQVDGDGQHPAEEIPVIFFAMNEKNADVVIGSRFISGKVMPKDGTSGATGRGFQSTWLRRAGIQWFGFLNRFLTNYDIKDSTSGFRMLNRKALAIVSKTYPDEYPEPEAIIIFAKKKLRITEIAVNMKERQGGKSSIGFFSGIYYMCKVTLGIFFTFIRHK